MSCVCILTPVVIAEWPVFNAAVVEAAGPLGYAIAEETFESDPETDEVDGESIHLAREGVVVTLSRDNRGRALICVTGEGCSDDELQSIGEELAGRVVQRYVHRRLLEEIRARQFVVVTEETDARHAIRLKVREGSAR